MSEHSGNDVSAGIAVATAPSLDDVDLTGGHASAHNWIAEIINVTGKYPLGTPKEISRSDVVGHFAHSAAMLELVRTLRPFAIIHTAAQPSHDRAAAIPFEDFDTNALGTMNLLEAARQFCPESPFVHMSTNKVYGDGPNRITLMELESR